LQRVLFILVIVAIVIFIIVLVRGIQASQSDEGGGQLPGGDDLRRLLNINLDLESMQITDGGDECDLRRSQGLLLMEDGADCAFEIGSVNIPIARMLTLRLSQGDEIDITIEQDDNLTIEQTLDRDPDTEEENSIELTIFSAGGTLEIENCDADENCRVLLNP
jgi:hypothetical protein